MNYQQTHILGAKLDLLSREQVVGKISKWLNEKDQRHIVTLNPEITLLGERDLQYRKILNRADLTVRDGFGLIIGSYILGAKRAPRITGQMLVNDLLKAAIKKNAGIYLLGGQGGTADDAAARLQADYPDLIISGAEEGMTKESFNLNSPDLVARINKSKAKILLVAFGAPKQELWIQNNLKHLNHISIAIGVGGIFDYLAGKVPIPPGWIQNIGLEWLFRLFTQKGRLSRIIKAVIIFPITCLKWRLRMFTVFRKNVIAAVINSNKQVLLVSPAWSSRIQWQFPQGGIDKNEQPDAAVLREMNEELGTDSFKILSHHRSVYRYKWPKWYRLLRGYKGQKQDLFLLKFIGKDRDINIDTDGELAAWKWTNQKDVVKELAPARKSIGRIVTSLIR